MGRDKWLQIFPKFNLFIIVTLISYCCPQTFVLHSLFRGSVASLFMKSVYCFLMMWCEYTNVVQLFLCSWKKWYSSRVLTTVWSIFHGIDRYNNRLLSLLCGSYYFFKRELLRLWITEYNVISSVWLTFGLIWSMPSNLQLHKFFGKASVKRIRIKGSASCISVLLMLLMHCTFSSWQVTFVPIQHIKLIQKEVTTLMNMRSSHSGAYEKYSLMKCDLYWTSHPWNQYSSPFLFLKNTLHFGWQHVLNSVVHFTSLYFCCSV